MNWTTDITNQQYTNIIYWFVPSTDGKYNDFENINFDYLTTT